MAKKKDKISNVIMETKLIDSLILDLLSRILISWSLQD